MRILKILSFLLMLNLFIVNVSYSSGVIPSSSLQLKFSLSEVVRKTNGAIVNIYADRIVKSNGSMLYDDPFFREFFAESFGGGFKEQLSRSLGSGVIIDKSGYIITNEHVISGADTIKIVLSDRRQYAAKVVGVSKSYDIALLKINVGEKDKLKVIKLADSEKVEVGDFVIAVGNPFGVGQSVTSGIISSNHRVGVLQQGVPSVYIQTDAPINRGNSGGALIDMNGELIGMNTFIYSPSGGSNGIGFAIPSSFLNVVVASLKFKGFYAPIYTGVTLQEITSEIASSLGLDRPKGVMVSQVDKKSLIYKSGVRKGDVLLLVNNKELQHHQDLNYYLSLFGVGNSADILLRKTNGSTRHVILKIDSLKGTLKPNLTTLMQDTPLKGSKIATLNPLYANAINASEVKQGVVLVDFTEHSSASLLGFKKNDIIISVNDKKVTNVSELNKLLLKKRNSWLISIWRNGTTYRYRFR